MRSTCGPIRWTSTSTRWRSPRRVPPARATLARIGFAPTNLAELKIPPGSTGGEALFHEFLQRMDRYGETRDFPAVKGPSYLGVHLRFGTVSIRRAGGRAHALAQAGRPRRGRVAERADLARFLLPDPGQFPACGGCTRGHTRSFKPEYDKIRWEHGKHAERCFKAWCEGRTGYPLVDAAMAQINQTGYMHNRLRMVVASFLCKDLGIDWRRGEPTLRRSSTTSTCRPTTAAGNGPAPAAATRSPISASSTR
jgi:deoxyribodipyrimidine photo-lyase